MTDVHFLLQRVCWKQRAGGLLPHSPGSSSGQGVSGPQLSYQLCQSHQEQLWQGSCSDSTEGCLQSKETVRGKKLRDLPFAYSNDTLQNIISTSKLDHRDWC